MLPMLNAFPELSLTIDVAAAGTHVGIVRDARTNALLFSINEDRGVLPLQLPLLGTGLLDLAEELDPSKRQRSPWGSRTLFCA
jgi:hypothetical protein